ncbi:hypothetical protein HaLaN_12898, partial [Haematococcus lacustris]
MLHVDVRTAFALRDFDKEAVLDELMTKGVLRVNRLVRQALADGAERACGWVRQDYGNGSSMATEDPVHAAHALHVCAHIIQLQGRYYDAVHVYKEALDILHRAAAERQRAQALQLVIHYTELLLLMKQWEPAHHMAQVAVHLAQSKQARHGGEGGRQRSQDPEQ